MSELYVESNRESSKDLFEKRNIYRVEVAGSAEEYTNLVDFNFGEKFFYGRVSRAFVPIELEPLALPLKDFHANAVLSGVNFVVDAFQDLAAYFAKCSAGGQIDPNDTFLSTLRPYRALTESRTLYTTYLTTQVNGMIGAMRSKNIKLKNFDEFLRQVEELLGVSAPTYPFTKPGFIKSRMCPINASGLAVEIADLDAANDQEKIDQFVSSKNWEFYLNACRQFGFMIDRNVPWRLVADIASSPMLEYASAYRWSTTDTILGMGYVPAYLKYFQNFKYYLLNMYNQAKLPQFLETQECGGTTITRRVIPRSYTMAQIDEIYSEAFFLQLYFKIRFLEEESPFTLNEKEMLVDDCLEVHQHAGTARALAIFERIVNKPFDYRGSLSYIIEYLDARAAEGS